MRSAPFQVLTDDGWTLHGDALLPDDAPPRAVVVCTHAMMTDRRSMDRPRGDGLASTLVRRGLAVLNADLRGHGESAIAGRSYDLEEIALHDVPALCDHARRAFPGLPFFWLGHSLGSNAALLTFGAFPELAPDAVVSLAPNLWLPSLEPRLGRRILKGAVVAAWVALALRPGGFDPGPFKMGRSRIPLRYVAQFARWYAGDALVSADGHLDYREVLGRVEVPILAFSSTGDALFAHPSSVTRYLGLLRRAKVTHRVVRGGAGRRAPSPAGLAADAGSRAVWEEAAAWLEARSARVPGRP